MFIRTGSPSEPCVRPLETSFQEDISQHVNLSHGSVHYLCIVWDFFPGAWFKVGVDLMVVYYS